MNRTKKTAREPKINDDLDSSVMVFPPRPNPWFSVDKKLKK